MDCEGQIRLLPELTHDLVRIELTVFSTYTLVCFFFSCRGSLSFLQSHLDIFIVLFFSSACPFIFMSLSKIRFTIKMKAKHGLAKKGLIFQKQSRNKQAKPLMV